MCVLHVTALFLVGPALGQIQPTPAQGKGQNGSSGAFVLKQNVREVLLYCTVFDGRGTLVTDLDRSAFRISENKLPVTIVNFSRLEAPVSIDLLLDNSTSMKDKRQSVRSAADVILRADKPQDEAAVTNFADSAYLDQEFTGVASHLHDAVSQSKTVSGGTALFDTLIAAADHLSSSAHHRKQVIVVITDGRDNASAVDLQAAIQRVQAVNGPVVYSIGLLFDVPGNAARHARHDLQVLSDETGGIAFFPRSAAEVDQTAEEVARDIRNQYTVSYRPPEDAPTGSYRTITVQASVKGRGKLSVRTRKGYVRSLAGNDEDRSGTRPADQP